MARALKRTRPSSYRAMPLPIDPLLEGRRRVDIVTIDHDVLFVVRETVDDQDPSSSTSPLSSLLGGQPTTFTME